MLPLYRQHFAKILKLFIFSKFLFDFSLLTLRFAKLTPRFRKLESSFTNLKRRVDDIFSVREMFFSMR